MEEQTIVKMCFMADLLFRSPHNTAAILFIDGGRESKQRAAIRGRKNPHSQRRVKGPDGLSGNRTSPVALSVGTFLSGKCVHYGDF